MIKFETWAPWFVAATVVFGGITFLGQVVRVYGLNMPMEPRQSLAAIGLLLAGMAILLEYRIRRQQQAIKNVRYVLGLSVRNFKIPKS
jgi:hypothetical protein